jgi:hypothetical protein
MAHQQRTLRMNIQCIKSEDLEKLPQSFTKCLAENLETVELLPHLCDV